MTNINKGDYSNLANDYTRYRPSYNQLIVDFLFGALNKPRGEIDAADIGAGTGIFTKLLLDKHPKTIYAIEPNDNMRSAGKGYLPNGVTWIAANAESTTLSSESIDLVSMASSFHWPKTNQALREFNRILRKDGIFTALWNPRITELSKTESTIDNILKSKYGITKRTSSGRSGITLSLTETLNKSGYFKEVSYAEAMNKVQVSPEHYIGAWRSVNDIRSQLGEKNFKHFIDDITDLTLELEHIEVHYLTRAWIGRK